MWLIYPIDLWTLCAQLTKADKSQVTYNATIGFHERFATVVPEICNYS